MEFVKQGQEGGVPRLGARLVRRRISPGLWDKSAAVRLDSLAGDLCISPSGAESASTLLLQSGYRLP